MVGILEAPDYGQVEPKRVPLIHKILYNNK
jgi:hypothetical protein